MNKRIVLVAVFCVGLGIAIGFGSAASQSLPANYYGNVTVSETGEATPEPVVVEVLADGEVQDSMETETELPYNLGGPSADDPKLEVQEPDDDEVTFRIADEVVKTVSWQSGPQDIDIEVSEDLVTPTFDVEIVETNSPIVEGETLTVEIEVTNVDPVGGSQTIELRNLNGTVVDAQERSLDANSSDMVTLTYETEIGDAGEGNITVASHDDDASHGVTIEHSRLRYADADDVVTTEGLRTAIGDWRNGEIQTELLRDVIDNWRSGEPIDKNTAGV